MPSARPANRTRKVANFMVGLALKLGPGFFGVALGGLIHQYIQGNPTGMLVFTLLLAAGLVLTTAAIVSED